MADIELVIKIPEELYEAYKGRPPMLGDAGMDMIAQSISKGTPLPKGHGVLKDVDRIKTAFPCGEYVRTESVRATIDHEDVIIPADKEKEDTGVSLNNPDEELEKEDGLR